MARSEPADPDDERTRSLRRSLTAVAVVTLLAGVAHVPWGLLLRGYPELAGLTEAQWRLVALLNHCVGLLLVATGTLALALARRGDAALVRVAAAVLFAMWAVRLGLELALPVPVPFVVAAPSRLIVPLIVALLAILAAPALRPRVRRRVRAA